MRVSLGNQASTVKSMTLFATEDSTTRAKLHAIFPHGYWHDENMWPWELYEMLNLAAAVERARDFDIIHYEAAYYPMSLAFARLSPTPWPGKILACAWCTINIPGRRPGPSGCAM